MLLDKMQLAATKEKPQFIAEAHNSFNVFKSNSGIRKIDFIKKHDQ
jgi:hypothetical protein